LEDAWLRRGGPAHCTEPPEVGRAPGGPAYRADGLPQEKRCEPKRRGLAIAESSCTRPTQVPHRCLLYLGPGDRGEVSRAHEACQCDGIPAVGFTPIAWFLGEQRRGDDPADLAFFHQRAGEPIPTRAGFRDKDEVLTFGLELTDECSDVTWAGTHIPARDALSVVVLSPIGDCNRIFMDIHANAECARLRPG
jgi:hypothetical protein